MLGSAVAIAMSAVAWLVAAPAPNAHAALEARLAGSALALAVVLTVLCYMHWSLIGSRVAAWLTGALAAWLAIRIVALALHASPPLLAANRPQASSTLLGVNLLEVAALLVALGAALAGLRHAWRIGLRRLVELEQRSLRAAAEVELERSRRAERAHEARNALTAIEAATHALQAHSVRMEPEERAALSEAVSAEIARLQRLVAGRPSEPEYGRFRLADAIVAVVTCERWLGSEIEVAVPDDLVAVGSPTSTAEVVQNLLQNARRHGAGPVQVSAVIEDAEVVLRVQDHGPGIPAHEAELVFERGRRGGAARRRPGSGLGLHVARELMTVQGGRLWLEDRDDTAGACFALALPGFTAAGTLYALPRPLPEDGEQVDGDWYQHTRLRHARTR